MSMDVSYWGVRDYEGIRFFIEPDTELNELCPFEKPSKKLLCPHKGLNENTYVEWRRLLYIPEKSEGKSFEVMQNLIPKGLEVRPELTFIYAGFLPTSSRLLYLLSLTNALPLMIYGITLQSNYNRIFQIARSSYIRPVYLSGSPEIPVPLDFKEN